MLSFNVLAAAPGRPAIRPRHLPFLAAVASLLLAPVWVVAQRVEGVIVESEEGAPIPGAHVRLLDPEGAALDSTSTDRDGRFQLDAPSPGAFLLSISMDGYLGTTRWLPRLGAGERLERRVELPLVSGAAARLMSEAISREAAFEAPLDELCGEPLRPGEAGILLGVARDRRTMEPLPGSVIRLLAPGGEARAAVATASGAYWFCNVPAGEVEVTVHAAGYRPDTYTSAIRAGTISWYDALLRRTAR